MSAETKSQVEASAELAAEEPVFEQASGRADDSRRPRVHLWLTARDQVFLMAVCVVLVALMGARAWQSSRIDASAEILTIEEPDIGYRIDVNSASAAEFRQLGLIGPVRSAQIVEDRDMNGPFESPDDLQRIKGIGPATIEKNRRWMRTGDDEIIKDSTATE